ncbi:type II toxin-antitoxin system HicA family toxin [Brachyspira intermedia]|uniref:type II toxin-antitoxin system HicA family toxin n=1 Tax=Brachyspira intermedia TaxID=84377 RepID=UPI00345B5D8F
MKDKLPKLNAKEAEKLLFDNGFILDREKGSHRILKKIINECLYLFILLKYCILK